MSTRLQIIAKQNTPGMAWLDDSVEAYGQAVDWGDRGGGGFFHRERNERVEAFLSAAKESRNWALELENILVKILF